MDIYLLKDHAFGIYNGRQGSCWVQPLARPASGPADASSLTLQLIFVILNRQSRTGSADLKGKKKRTKCIQGLSRASTLQKTSGIEKYFQNYEIWGKKTKQIKPRSQNKQPPPKKSTKKHLTNFSYLIHVYVVPEEEHTEVSL